VLKVSLFRRRAYGWVNGAVCVCCGDSHAGEQTHIWHWCCSSYWQFGVVMQ